LNRAGDRADEVHHLACDGNIDDVSGFAARAQPAISGAEPDLRFPPDVANDFWQRFDPVDLVTASFYKWKAKYGGLEVFEAKWLKALENENTRLKRRLADAMWDNAALTRPSRICAQPMR
jgi:hypothetical protein